VVKRFSGAIVGITFEYNKAVIRPDSFPVLDEAAAVHLAAICDGDARRCLNALELAALTTRIEKLEALVAKKKAERKPRPEAFRAVLSALGIDDARGVVMVGDSLGQDVAGTLGDLLSQTREADLAGAAFDQRGA
jgi:FMN phosphatase YigB (HAD superfamily)